LQRTKIDTRMSRRAINALVATLVVSLGWAASASAQAPYTVAPSAYGSNSVTYVAQQPTYTYAAPQPTYTYAAPQPTYTYAPQTAAPAYTYQYQAQYAAPAAAAAPTTGGGDAYGFLNWLNGVRAQNGLAPVSYDAGLEGWAAQNSAAQASRGLGHFVMGPARRQNSAMGSAASIGWQWMNSPAHRAALLDPSIRAIGLAAVGSYWTFNAY
jgi:uncharacterized protein YkwD